MKCHSAAHTVTLCTPSTSSVFTYLLTYLLTYSLTVHLHRCTRYLSHVTLVAFCQLVIKRIRYVTLRYVTSILRHRTINVKVVSPACCVPCVDDRCTSLRSVDLATCYRHTCQGHIRPCHLGLIRRTTTLFHGTRAPSTVQVSSSSSTHQLPQTHL